MEVPYQMKELFLAYAWSYLGTCYIYGGNSRDGIDCSGFVCECLRAVEVKVRDNTAHGLFTHYVIEGNQMYNKDVPQRGDLLFFGNHDKISHIAIALNKHMMIESGGAGRLCKTKEQAYKLNAGVRVRMIGSRRDFYTSSTIF